MAPQSLLSKLWETIQGVAGFSREGLHGSCWAGTGSTEVSHTTELCAKCVRGLENSTVQSGHGQLPVSCLRLIWAIGAGQECWEVCGASLEQK